MPLSTRAPHVFDIEIDYWTVRTLHSVLKEHFKVNYSHNYLYEMIRRRGYTLKKPRPRHYKADPQRANCVKRQIKQIVAAGYPVFYEDETKVKLTTRMAKVIAKRGQAVIMRVNVDHRRVFVLGAINVRSREVTILLSDRANSKSVMKLLYKLKAQVGRGRLYVVWDNNGSHISKRVKYLAKKKGIHLVQLPPYMPELNPMEAVWKQLKQYVANKLFFEIEALKWEVMKFFATRGYKFKIKIERYFSE
ncbi:MAG: IS630 family transposase [Candidatus Asgardarchaeia archaeon]